MPIETQHKQYQDMLPEWKLNRIMCDGVQSVKRHFDDYIVSPFRTGEEDKHERYKKLSVFTEFTFRTVDTLKGMAFAKEPVITLPNQIDYLLQNADASGNGLSQAMKLATHSVITDGRYGVLVDYPQIEEDLTLAQIKSLGLRASIFGYKAESIINWRSEGDKRILVVLSETYVSKDDGFEQTHEVQYRALRLIDGVYTVQIYRKSELYTEYQPRDYQGNLFDHIPFYFVGSLNNDDSCDRPPISSIADLNRAYFQNSCDLELHAHTMAGATLHVSFGENETNDTFLEANGEDQLKVGTYSVIKTQQGGKVEFIEPKESTLTMKMRQEKRDELLLLGAKLINDTNSNITATQAKIVNQGETSTLSDIVDNVADSYSKALQDAALFMMEQPTIDDIEVEFDKSFYEQMTDAQTLSLLYQAVLGGYMTKQDWHGILVRSGHTDIEDYQEWSNILGDNESGLVNGIG